ncbi:MAG: hypothetical protein ACLR4Z_08855 [Butyricicoccaceae bacterium]
MVPGNRGGGPEGPREGGGVRPERAEHGASAVGQSELRARSGGVRGRGYRPPFLLYEYLLPKKKPEKELLYTDIAIRTKYNSDMALVCTTMQNGL